MAFEFGDYEGATCAASDNYTFNGLNQISGGGFAFAFWRVGN